MIWFNNWSISGALPITEDGGESFNNFNDSTHVHRHHNTEAKSTYLLRLMLVHI